MCDSRAMLCPGQIAGDDIIPVADCHAGFTAVDVLGHGTMGHVIGVGAILSLRVRVMAHNGCCSYFISPPLTQICRE